MTSFALPQIHDVSIERAYEVAEQLTNKSSHATEAMMVFSGVHSEYGPVHVVIPPLGDATLLPIVLQGFEL